MDALKSSALYRKAEDFFLSRLPRDQLSLTILAIFLLVLFVIFGLISPASNYMSSAEKKHQRSLEKLSWMQTNKVGVVQLLKQRTQRDPGQSLLGIANSSSKTFQISFKRYEPVGDNGLSLWMENISFNRMVLWLERLDKRYGISVTEISVDRQEQQGLVNVRLVLQG